jgi:hypothetical protein
LFFHYSKNAVPGLIQIAAQLPDNSTNTITGFEPDAGCGAYSTGEGSHQVRENGKIHLLSYAPIAGLATCVNLTISGESQVQIAGNCDLKTFVVDIKRSTKE